MPTEKRQTNAATRAEVAGAFRSSDVAMQNLDRAADKKAVEIRRIESRRKFLRGAAIGGIVGGALAFAGTSYKLLGDFGELGVVNQKTAAILNKDPKYVAVIKSEKDTQERIDSLSKTLADLSNTERDMYRSTFDANLNDKTLKDRAGLEVFGLVASAALFMGGWAALTQNKKD